MAALSTVLEAEVLLPPAYVVRREGNSFTLLVCPHLGGGGQSADSAGGEVSQLGGSASQGGVGQSARGGQSADSAGGVSQLGGGQSARGVSWGRGESAKIGQQNEYSLHGGQYASCIHTGGLSCFTCFHYCLVTKTDSKLSCSSHYHSYKSAFPEECIPNMDTGDINCCSPSAFVNSPTTFK